MAAQQPAPRTENEYLGEAMPLTEHLRELRDRLIKALIALAVTTAIGAFFASQFLAFLVEPLPVKPQSITPTEPIVTYFKVALILGLVLAMPVIVYQVIAYLLPALTRREARYLFILVPAATILFALGIAFGATIALPAALRFLAGFGTSFSEFQPSLDEYVSFITTVLLWLGLGFQTPLIIFFLAKLRIVSYQTLVKNVRWAVLVVTILAAVITPTPDPFNMMIVAVPLMLLYLFGVLLARFA
ncbi:MAG: twin-arginine translocase subunit TatC [Ardenticatenaceae bacterium]|nr:twin-arginine translocase subunit TatC [Ardenticatenaceae bacterium]HBY93996.1 twin-arginine translocase subunit TatC [Chloroflexota bacterium]